MLEEEVERLRGLVRDCLSKHLYSSAIFFADKVAASTSDPADIYMQAQALFLGRQYRRALHLLNSSSIVLRDLRFRYLAAKCLEELKEWHQCLTMLGDAKVDEHGNLNSPKDCSPMYLDKDGEDHDINITAAVCYLRGKAYEALENRIQAKLWYIAAVKSDPFCYEALESLVDKHMLTWEEESSLLSSLQFGKEDGWLSTIYSCLVKRHEKENVVEEKLRDIERDSPCSTSNSPFILALKNNADLLACNAEYYYQLGEYYKCFELTSSLLAKDPFHMKCTLVHLAAAMELGHCNDLYLLACNLIKDHPLKAISWFAIGCYYFSIKKYDQARKHFSKATSVDATFPPAWIGSGNSYALQEETDQAMLAYRTAARLFPGCHLPTLYIGMEYMRTHNFKLSEHFILQARTICPTDPLVYNELGVVSYHMKEYQKAVRYFEMTLNNVASSMSELWEPTLVNLGHSQRKLKMYHKAVSSYEKALALSTQSMSAFAGLAYTYHLMDNLDAAVTYYHKALWLKPEDQFCTEMLTMALELQTRGICFGDDGLYTKDGSVDINGNPVLKHKTGNWKACPFILGTECCERLAYYGIATNLVTYLTTKLHQGNAAAARNVTTWQGTCYLAPLIGAVLADAYWGRYWTIAVFSTVYFIGMATLTLSASVPQFKPPACVDSVCPEATIAQYGLFFMSLYLIALGTGGIKPCVSSFGADQFDDTDSQERRRKGSFFNWFYFSINIGSLISSSFLVWVQDNRGWGLGFGIPTLFMGIAIGSFFAGTYLYRFQKPGGSPLTRMCQVVIASIRNWNVKVPLDSSLLFELPDKHSAIEGSRKLEHSDELKFFDKAATAPNVDAKPGDISNPWRLCTVTQVEELKILVRMFPIWASGIVFSAVYAQISTMFVEQGMVLDTTIGSFTIPPASLSTFDVISVIVWVPIYDSILVPVVRRFTGKERGFSELQRMGIGLFISIAAMAAAAFVEIRRLDIAEAKGLVHVKAAVPMSILWQIPQYFLVGAAEVFTFIGQMEFFYDQSPDAMRSLCSALSLLTTALGNYLSSFIMELVTYVTTKGGKPGWIPDNLNEGQLYNFFWLIAVLSFLNLLLYAFCAHRYKCKHAA